MTNLLLSCRDEVLDRHNFCLQFLLDDSIEFDLIGCDILISLITSVANENHISAVELWQACKA